MNIQGCVKGKHRSKHHTEYFYVNYLLYMRSLVINIILLAVWVHQPWGLYLGPTIARILLFILDVANILRYPEVVLLWHGERELKCA